MKKNELTLWICNIMSKRYNILPTNTSFFILRAEKIKRMPEFRI